MPFFVSWVPLQVSGQRQEFGLSDSALLLVNGSTAFFVTFSDGLHRQISSSSSSLLQSPA